MNNIDTTNTTTLVVDTESEANILTQLPGAEETEIVTLEEIVAEITDTVFGTSATITAYKIANVINSVFKATGTDKAIPPQMMYNYASKGMITKVKGQKQYTKDEVTTYVLKYTSKYVQA